MLIITQVWLTQIKLTQRNEINFGYVDHDSLSDTDKTVASSHRQLQEQLRDMKKTTLENAEKISRAKKKIEKIHQALKKKREEKLTECIKHMNRMQAKEIRDWHEGDMKTVTINGKYKSLQVFCVSARAFMLLEGGNSVISHFNKLSDTGIPALQAWIIETTLATRNRHAVAFLEAIVSFKISMEPWISDNSVEFRISEDMRISLQTEFESNYSQMTIVSFCVSLFIYVYR